MFKNFGLNKQKVYFLENLSMLIDYGQNLITSLEAIKKDLPSQRMGKIVQQIEQGISSGLPLWQAMAKTEIFSKKIISLIKIGEESGKLKENLKILANQEQKDRQFSDNLRSAMIYPCFVFFITLIIGLGIMWFFLPILASVFLELDIALPLITVVVLKIALFLQLYGYIAVPLILIALIVLVYFVFFFPRTQYIGQAIIFKIPVFKRLIKEMARFGYTLGSLLAAGLSLPEAILAITQSAQFYRYKNFYQYLYEKINDGFSFERAFNEYKNLNQLISQPIQQLIISASQSGKLIEVNYKISDLYSEKIAITTKNAATMLEPVLLVIVWLGVLAIGVSVILPIYSLVGQINP